MHIDGLGINQELARRAADWMATQWCVGQPVTLPWLARVL